METWQTEYDRAIKEINYHHGQKTKWIFYAIEQLVIGGFPIDKISAKLKKDLEGLASDELIQKCCAAIGATDQRFSSTDEAKEAKKKQLAETAAKQIIELTTGNSAATFVELPPEGDRQPVGLPPQISSTSINTRLELDRHFELIERDFAAENKPYIKHLQETISLLKDIIYKLEHNAFIYTVDDSSKSNFSQEELKDFEEFWFLSEQARLLCRQAFDDRNTIPTFTQPYLAEIVQHTSIKHAADVYISKVKELFSLSSKQVTKTLRGIVRDVHYWYEPTTQAEALLDGFYGKQCKECASWRVKYEYGFCRCYACDIEYEAKAEPVPQTQLNTKIISSEDEPTQEDDNNGRFSTSM